MEPKDRRQCPRFEETIQADLLNMGDDPNVASWEAVVPAVALDVSKHGLRLQSVYNVEVGSLISVIAYYRHRDSICLCEVVWKRAGAEGQHLYGLYVKEWTRLDPALQKQLDAMEGEARNAVLSGSNNSRGTVMAPAISG